MVVVLVLLVASSALSQGVNYVDYLIDGDEVFVELGFVNASNLDLRLPPDAKSIELNTDGYILENHKDHKLIRINESERLKVSYLTRNLIDRTEDSQFFVMENYFDKPMKVRVILPESAILSKSNIIFPFYYKVTTDGRRIIVSFDDFRDDQILVKYEFMGGSNFFFYFFSFILGGFFVSLYFFRHKVPIRIKRELETAKFSEPVKSEGLDITRNLFEDEKRIVKFLLHKKNRESWTKELVRGLGISKVKLSRKLRSLEQKELIKKIPHGNENLIRLLT